MKQAEKFGRPVVTFINTAGAYPGVGAEERGQGEAIARNLMETVSYTHLLEKLSPLKRQWRQELYIVYVLVNN